MLMLVMADNLLLLYASWELVGLCSFLLIGFYWEKRSAVEAAKKAFITTRVGDVGLLIGIILLWDATGTFNIGEIIEAVEHGEVGDTRLFVTMMFVFLGAMGKSAQFPFHVWLPDAMEGPTPVSALIHAATMVVAGVYLVARLLPVFEVADGALLVVTIVGPDHGVVRRGDRLRPDRHQEGARVLHGEPAGVHVRGARAPASSRQGMLHLMTHAFFKALLFLGSGSVILGTHHNQEMDKLGGLWRKMPVTMITFAIGSLALAGAFPLAGFWSKDEIFHVVDSYRGSWAYVLLAIASIMTAFYTTRLFIRTFLGKPQDHHVYDHTRETGPIMTLPLVFLALLSIGAGFVIFHDVGECARLPRRLPRSSCISHEPEKFHVDWGLVAFSSALFISGHLRRQPGSTGRAASIAQRRWPAWQPKVYEMVRRKFYFDELYQFVIDRVVLGFSYLVSWFDRYAVNDTGVDGSAQMTGLRGLGAEVPADGARAELRDGDRRGRRRPGAYHTGGEGLGAWDSTKPKATCCSPPSGCRFSRPSCCCSHRADQKMAVRWISAVAGAFMLGLSIYIFVAYQADGDAIQMQMRWAWIENVAFLGENGISLHLGVDGISSLMVLLTGIVAFAGTLVAWKLEYRNKDFFILYWVLVAGVYGTFFALDLFFFFFFYELAVVPLYLLIGVWGSTRKEYGAMKLTLMLVGGSVGIWIGIFAVVHEAGLGTFDLPTLWAAGESGVFSENFQRAIFPFFVIGCGVLAALWPFHTWSPDGHMSAPTAGLDGARGRADEARRLRHHPPGHPDPARRRRSSGCRRSWCSAPWAPSTARSAHSRSGTSS